MNEQKLTAETRLIAMILDHVVMGPIIMVFMVPGMVSKMATAFTVTHAQVDTNVFGGMNYLALVGFALLLCKDCINGRSIAKRILKLQVVDHATGKVASPIQCFVRDILNILWPIVVVVALVNPSRRIGDRVAGTRLVVFDKTLEQPKLNFKQIAISLALAYGLMILLMLPFSFLRSNSPKVPFVEASYNKEDSKLTEQLFADSLGQSLTADIRVYDKIQNSDLKYVSVIFMLKENHLEKESDFETIKAKTTKLLLARFPEKTFVGQLKYVYQTSGYLTYSIVFLDWQMAN